MKKVSIFLAALGSTASYLLAAQWQAHQAKDTVLSVEMNLSAVGVESDTYPSIAATLDFERHTSHCERSYFDPAYPSSTYHLSAGELDSVQLLLQQTDLERLKTSYSVGSRSDQPTSTTVIRTAGRTFTVKDYGLEGAAPLPRLYRLVYKLEY